MEGHVEMSTKLKEDALKQLKRIGVQMKEYQREADESRAAKEEMSTQYKDLERKLKTMEAELLQHQEDITGLERAKKVKIISLLNINPIYVVSKIALMYLDILKQYKLNIYLHNITLFCFIYLIKF